MKYLPDSAVTRIVIHYTGSPVEYDTTAAVVDRWHRTRKPRPFAMIGYHYFIRLSGEVELGRNMARPGKWQRGAHVLPGNSTSIGICFAGGVTRADPETGFDSRSPAQTEAMIGLIDELLVRFPGARVVGHRDMPGAATQCPGFDAGAWWDEIVQLRQVARWRAIPAPPERPAPVSGGAERKTGLAAALVAVLVALAAFVVAFICQWPWLAGVFGVSCS